MSKFKNPLARLTGGKGFRKEKKLNKKQLARREEGQAFIDEYKLLCDKHGKKLDIIYSFDKKEGMRGLLQIAEHTLRPTQVKDSFADAKQENFDLRDTCEHQMNQEAKDGVEGAMSFCTQCRLPSREWGNEGKGFGSEFRIKHLESVERERAKEEALKK